MLEYYTEPACQSVNFYENSVFGEKRRLQLLIVDVVYPTLVMEKSVADL